ncbi:MAG: 4Fe-4S binding protein [Spirochaetes bacterium]|nr:4Fe-4S binding protein [Spirochaetota bacterium]
MKRKIIEIDEKKCNGCGVCIPGCPEGALQMIDGKARMVAEYFCDGLGACIGECPQKAIKVIEREAEAYDERKTIVNIIAKGENTIRAHLKHLYSHGENTFLAQAVEELEKAGIEIPDYKTGVKAPGVTIENDAAEAADVPSTLRSWPVQLKLISPMAPFLKNADLLFAADCTAFAYGNFHKDFLLNRIGIILCPKLDNSAEEYIEKTSEIIRNNDIRSITVLRMQVPCCGGITYIVQEAVKRSGIDIHADEKIISIDGNILK